MLRRLKIEPDVVFTGGVAMNGGVVKAINEQLGFEVLVPRDSLITGALGAALLAKETALTAAAKGESLRIEKRTLKEASFFNNEQQ
jgi:activator of 2-hydroxyglutaryl-CoA dehydratase